MVQASSMVHASLRCSLSAYGYEGLLGDFSFHTNPITAYGLLCLDELDVSKTRFHDQIANGFFHPFALGARYVFADAPGLILWINSDLT